MAQTNSRVDNAEKRWQEIVGELPEGFFLQVTECRDAIECRKYLSLNYNGKLFKKVIPKSGKPTTGDFVIISIFDINGMQNETDKNLKIQWIREDVAEIQKQIDKLSHNPEC